MTAPVLSPEAVQAMLRSCLAADSEPDQAGCEIQGVVHCFRFNPRQIGMHTPGIKRLLAELPDEFWRSKGGGWSFLKASVDRHGWQWTDLHRDIETLVCLGIAAGVTAWVLPRDMWPELPGGMPYFFVDPAP